MDQGTIKEFDERTRVGSLLTDARDEVGIDGESIEGSGIRTLRIGQRVKFESEEIDGRPVARTLQLVTFD